MEAERILPVILRAMLIADLLQPEILIFAPLIVFAAYIVFGITGFGSTLIAIPLLAHLFPLKFAVPFFVILDCVGAFNMGLRLRADVMRSELLLLIPFMGLGILAGVWLLMRLHPELLLGGLGDAAARAAAYDVMSRISLPGSHFRTDIALSAAEGWIRL